MKNENDLEYRVEKRKPIRIILDKEDLGIFTYNEYMNKYVGEIIGCIDLDKLILAIRGRIDFIKVEMPNE